MDNPLFINANHHLFGISRVWLDDVDVTDNKVIWVDLGGQRLCYKAPDEQILKTGDAQGEIVSGKIEISPQLKFKTSFDLVIEYIPELERFVRKDEL